MKQFERLMRGAHDGLSREVPKEIYQLAAQHATIARDEVASLYVRALKQTRPDSPELRYEFLRLLKEAHPPRKRIAPTKRTLTAALYGDPNRWAAPKPGVSPGGKRTRTMTLKEELAKRKRYLEMRAYFAEAERTGTPIPNEVKFPHYYEVTKLLAVGREKLADGANNNTGNTDAHRHRHRHHQGRAQRDLGIDAALRPDLHAYRPVQRKSTGHTGEPPSPALPTGGGRPMPEEVQAKMERALDADFSAVRIHEGAHVKELGALAYTQGTDVHFAPGQYAPGSQRGQELLGHELAHVVQQSQGRVKATTQAHGVAINDDKRLEREADEMGARAAQSESVTEPDGEK